MTLVERDAFAAENSPRRLPLTYPGTWPAFSALVSRTHVWELRDRDGNALSWNESDPQRLSVCRVRLDEPSIDRLGLSRSNSPHIVTVLEESDVVSVDSCIPVLAIGSNAAPSQLRHKFEDRGVPLMIPGVRARVSGVQLGFGAFTAPRGYVPATIFPSPGSEVELVVQWLDAAALREIDRTETSRYRRVWLDETAGVSILLETGERLAGAYAYVAGGGVLGEDGEPWVMATPGATRPRALAEARWMPHQAATMARLQQSSLVSAALGTSPEHFLERFESLGDHGVALFAEAGFTIAENAFALLPDTQRQPARQYGSLLPALEPVAGDPIAAVVSRSPDAVERYAQSVVRLDPSVLAALGSPGHVEIASRALVNDHGDAAPRALAVVLPARANDAPAPAAGSGLAQVDHVLRMAAGVAVGEPILITPVQVPRRKWPDALFGRPNYLTLRVTLADPSSAERDVSLMSALSLQLLGVNSGDHVVLEGAPDESGEVASVTIKAFETPDGVWAERDRVTGGSWGARFPGAREALGVHPDIPTVFIDSATRARLGINTRQLASVRARPARLQQFGNELREVMLVLVIALIGIIGLFAPDPIVSSWLLVGIVLITFVLMLVKMRRRLSHTLDRGFRRRARR